MEFHSVVVLLAIAVACLLSGRTMTHYFQLESYQFPGYFKSLRRHMPRVILPGAILNLLWIGGAWLFASIIPEDRVWLLSFCMCLLLITGGFGIRRLFLEKNEKKPLRMTPRLKRFYGISLIVFMCILMICVHCVSAGGIKDLKLSIPFLLVALFPLFLPLWIALGGLVAWPVEKGISELYFRDAQRILNRRPDLIRIGITGSWGKTSVKFILGTLLEEKYHTLVTPASFNTPMGVTKVIRTQLEPGHRVFVSEMGARHVGDIREMCRLVHPALGIITSVGPQHLDTFKTLERVKNTKYELIEALPGSGTAFFSDDGGICRELYEKTSVKKWISGIGPEGHDLWAEDIQMNGTGSHFTLCHGNQKTACETSLLGELNIRNILLAASVCLELGLSDRQIANGIRKLQPVEHRLQLISNPGGLSVIDDAFNSNILGAEQALHVLKDFPGRRIVVTPGMVELGNQEAELNRQLGQQMSESCDTAILVGEKRSIPIREGLLDKGFPETQIFVVTSLEEAQVWLRENARSGDTVLFENDLPDNYTEG